MTVMRFSLLLLRAVALCLLVLGASVQAQDHIVERAWLEDPTGELSWAEVQQRPTQAFTGVLTRGYGASVIWLRLRLDPGALPPPQREPERLVIRIRPVYLDDIQLYDPLVPQGLVGITGDRHHPGQDEFKGLDFMLPLARGEAPRELWLRLASTSSRQIHVQALNVEDLNRLAHRQALIFAGYVSFVFIFAVWGLVYWLFSHERIIGAFSLAQGAALIYALCSLGYLRSLWPGAWPAWPIDQASTLFSIIGVSSAILFHVTLVREFSPPSWARRLYLAMLGLLPLKLVLVLAGLPIIALQLNLCEVLCSPLVFLVSVWRSRAWQASTTQRPVLSRPLVLTFYSLFTPIIVLAAMPGLGLAEGGEIELYMVQIHGLLTAFLVLLMLQYRGYMMNQRQRDTALTLERTLLQAQQERRIREEQSKLMAMLAHELKTPLATMHLRLDPNANGSPQIKKALRDMNGVIERCLQVTQLNDGQLMTRPERGDVVKLLCDAVLSCAQPARVHLSAPSRLEILADRQLLFIVLSNLLDNACKYAAPDTPIQVELRCQLEDGTLRISVRNQPGPAGRPEADKMFDKYYRSPHAKRQAGTGLGLFLARNLMQTMGGRILYEPDETWVQLVVEMPMMQ